MEEGVIFVIRLSNCITHPTLVDTRALKPEEREPHLDGLRGCAAIVVMFAHFLSLFYYPVLSFDVIENSYLNTIRLSPLNLLFSGNTAVCIFFVLSGYILTYKFFLKNTSLGVRSGMIRRYLRLIIPVLFVSAIGYAFMNFGLFHNQQIAGIAQSYHLFSTIWTFQPSFPDFLHTTFISAFFYSPEPYNHYYIEIVSWFLYYEFTGSMLVYVLTWLVLGTKNRFVIYVILSIVLWNTYYEAFLAGLVIADIKNSQLGHTYYSSVMEIFWVRALCIIGGLYFGSYPESISNNGVLEKSIYSPLVHVGGFNRVMMYHIIGAALIFLCVLTMSRIRSLLSSRATQFFGKISFSLYLTHLVVICSVSSILFLKLLEFFPYKIAFIATFSISVPLILAFSYFVYRYIDLPGIRFAHHVYKTYFSKEGAL